jgi:hypothetical protein
VNEQRAFGCLRWSLLSGRPLRRPESGSLAAAADHEPRPSSRHKNSSRLVAAGWRRQQQRSQSIFNLLLLLLFFFFFTRLRSIRPSVHNNDNKWLDSVGPAGRLCRSLI